MSLSGQPGSSSPHLQRVVPGQVRVLAPNRGQVRRDAHHQFVQHGGPLGGVVLEQGRHQRWGAEGEGLGYSVLNSSVSRRGRRGGGSTQGEGGGGRREEG